LAVLELTPDLSHIPAGREFPDPSHVCFAMRALQWALGRSFWCRRGRRWWGLRIASLTATACQDTCAAPHLAVRSRAWLEGVPPLAARSRSCRWTWSCGDKCVWSCSWDPQLGSLRSIFPTLRHASRMLQLTDFRGALSRSCSAQQNGCWQRFEDYLSCQQRLHLAVA
jgi:hypothetical protein